MIRTFLFFMLLLVPAYTATAQFGFVQKLFDSVNSVSFGAYNGWLEDTARLASDADVGDVQGLNAEVFIDLPAPEGLFLELALGASYLRGYESNEPTLDLRSALRSFPSLGFYLTWDQAAVQPYVGATFGLVELWNTRAYDPEGRQFAFDGQTFQYGLTLGIHASLFEPVGLFVETNYRWRRFSSLDWQFPSGVEALPAAWPRSLNLSGPGVSIGIQFALQRDE